MLFNSAFEQNVTFLPSTLKRPCIWRELLLVVPARVPATPKRFFLSPLGLNVVGKKFLLIGLIRINLFDVAK